MIHLQPHPKLIHIQPYPKTNLSNFKIADKIQNGRYLQNGAFDAKTRGFSAHTVILIHIQQKHKMATKIQNGWIFYRKNNYFKFQWNVCFNPCAARAVYKHVFKQTNENAAKVDVLVVFF